MNRAQYRLSRRQDKRARRRAAAGRYDALLADAAGLVRPEVSPGHAFHQYTVRIPDGRRDAVQGAGR